MREIGTCATQNLEQETGKSRPVEEERQRHDALLVGGPEEGDEVGDDRLWFERLHDAGRFTRHRHLQHGGVVVSAPHFHDVRHPVLTGIGDRQGQLPVCITVHSRKATLSSLKHQ